MCMKMSKRVILRAKRRRGGRSTPINSNDLPSEQPIVSTETSIKATAHEADSITGVKRRAPDKRNLANERMQRLRRKLNPLTESNSTPSTPDDTVNKPSTLSDRLTAIRNCVNVERGVCDIIGIVETVDPLSIVKSFSMDDTEMDWDAEDPGMTDNFKITGSDGWMQASCTEPVSIELFPTGDVYVVVDTNIFIHSVNLVKDIANLAAVGQAKSIVFVSWMVLEELEHLKSQSPNSELSAAARCAVRLINELLQSHPMRVKGQSQNDYFHQISTDKKQDNKILASCLQLIQAKHKVVLLTDDINLRNKCLVSQVTSCNSKEVIQKLRCDWLTRNQQIQDHCANLCLQVILDCVRSVYGDSWHQMKGLRERPTDLAACILVFRRLWQSVFHERFMKQFQTAAKDLLNYLNNSNASDCRRDDEANLNELIRLTTRLALFFKDVQEYRGYVEAFLQIVNTIQESK